MSGVTKPEGGAPCAAMCERLVDGVRPADDVELAGHLRGCLPCYRVSIEMESLPEITAALKAGADEVDPGELFFAGFVRGTADAWQAARDGERRRQQQRRAAFGIGAALLCAAAALVVAPRFSGTGNLAALKPPAARQLPAQAGTPASGQDAEPTDEDDLESDDDLFAAIEQLDATALRNLAAPAEFEAASDDPLAGFSAAESLELLDRPALASLSEDLRAGNVESLSGPAGDGQ